MLVQFLQDTKTGLNMQGFYEGNTFERKRLGRLVEPLDHEARMTLDEGEGKEG